LSVKRWLAQDPEADQLLTGCPFALSIAQSSRDACGLTYWTGQAYFLATSITRCCAPGPMTPWAA